MIPVFFTLFGEFIVDGMSVVAAMLTAEVEVTAIVTPPAAVVIAAEAAATLVAVPARRGRSFGTRGPVFNQ